MNINAQKLKTAVPIFEYFRSELGEPSTQSAEYGMFHCPFHDDNTPSLTVWEKGNWKCSACDEKGGDVFQFYMERTGQGFCFYEHQRHWGGGEMIVKTKPRASVHGQGRGDIQKTSLTRNDCTTPCIFLTKKSKRRSGFLEVTSNEY